MVKTVPHLFLTTLPIFRVKAPLYSIFSVMKTSNYSHTWQTKIVRIHVLSISINQTFKWIQCFSVVVCPSDAWM